MVSDMIVTWYWVDGAVLVHSWALATLGPLCLAGWYRKAAKREFCDVGRPQVEAAAYASGPGGV